MQVCQGKAAPLRRIQPGDGVAYYSPARELGGKVPYRAFTAVGIVTEGDPFLFDMGDASNLGGERFDGSKRGRFRSLRCCRISVSLRVESNEVSNCALACLRSPNKTLASF